MFDSSRVFVNLFLLTLDRKWLPGRELVLWFLACFLLEFSVRLVGFLHLRSDLSYLGFMVLQEEMYGGRYCSEF